MRTCDRCWARGDVAEAHHTISIDHQHFDLCDEDMLAVKEFLAEPSDKLIGQEIVAELEGKASATHSNRRPRLKQ